MNPKQFKFFRSFVSWFLSFSVFSSPTFFFLLLLFLPTQLGLHFWPDFTRVFGLRIDYLAPTIYLTDIFIVFLLASWARETLFTKQARLSFQFSAPPILYSLFVIFVVFNILFAYRPLVALFKWFRLVELLLLFLYIKKFHPPTPCISQFLIPLSLATVAISLLAILQFSLQRSLNGPLWFLGERALTASTPSVAKVNFCNFFSGSCQLVLRPYATFSHPNSLAGFLLISLILILGLSRSLPFLSSHAPQLAGRDNPDRNFLRVFPLIHNLSFIIQPAIALGTVALFLSFSRTAWFTALAISLLWLTFKLFPIFKKPPAYYSLFLILISLSFFSPFLLSRLAASSPLSPSESVARRLALFSAAQKVFQTYAFLGAGLGNFIPTLPQFISVASTLSLLQPIHNLSWLILVETGIVGSFFALYALFKTIQRLVTAFPLIPHSSFLALSLAAILITGSTDHYWLTLPQNQLLLTVVFGLIWQQKA